MRHHEPVAPSHVGHRRTAAKRYVCQSLFAGLFGNLVRDRVRRHQIPFLPHDMPWRFGVSAQMTRISSQRSPRPVATILKTCRNGKGHGKKIHNCRRRCGVPRWQPAGSAQEPTFRGANRTVAVYATVTDQNGRLVPDLTRDAFSIQENGKPQPLTLFANEIQPITVVILLDRSTSMRANFGLVQKAAERFVDVMRPEDKARIGTSRTASRSIPATSPRTTRRC